MDHIVLGLYILMITAAGAGTAASIVLHLRLRTSVTRATAGVTSVFLAALVLGVVSYYLQVVLPPAAYPMQAFTILGVVLGVTIYTGLFLLLLAINRRSWPLHVAGLAVTLLAQIGRGVLGAAGTAEALERVRLPAIGLISLYLLYTGVVSIRAGRDRDSSDVPGSSTVASLVLRLGWLLVVFAPVSTAFYAILYQLPSRVRPPVSLDFVFALAWSIILISVFVKHLSTPAPVAAEGIPARFREAHGITERESDVIELVAEGLTNKEIADRLFVSLATVRTHLYNVFRKTGAKSRVDLLRIARQYSGDSTR